MILMRKYLELMRGAFNELLKQPFEQELHLSSCVMEKSWKLSHPTVTSLFQSNLLPRKKDQEKAEFFALG